MPAGGGTHHISSYFLRQTVPDGLARNLSVLAFGNLTYSGAFLLGSRLIDRQSQNRTVAARATAERKVLAHLS